MEFRAAPPWVARVADRRRKAVGTHRTGAVHYQDKIKASSKIIILNLFLIFQLITVLFTWVLNDTAEHLLCSPPTCFEQAKWCYQWTSKIDDGMKILLSSFFF
ncbi:hypothetical protein LIER_03520 [Lithospermum erythrorhizon]|uniref:Uncharacterized protein n=1 Tax=Lithospermum erythrorhizon TaxID=34254 RepID=A0AAV3NY63_LITER